MHHVQRLQRRNATELLHFFAAGDGSLAVQHASVSSASYCQQILDALHAVHGRGGEPSTSGCESDERSSPQFWSPRISTFWSARKNALSPQRSRAPTYSQYLRRQLHALHYHVPSWTASVGPGKVAWLDAAFSNPFLLSEISAGIFKPARRQLVGCVQLATPHGSPLLVHRPYCQIADRSTGGLRALRAAPVRKPFSVGGREAAQAGGSGSAAGAGVDGNGRGSAATAAPGSDAGGSAAAAASGDGGGGSAGSSNVRQLATQRHVLRSGPSVQNVCVQEILGRAKMNTVFEVIVIRSDGRTLEPNGGVTASELGLHSRDLSLFARDSRLSPQRATIAVRGDRILFRTEAIKAVIERDQCTLIKNTRDRDFHDIIKPMTLVIEAQPHVPFELSVLEVLLHVTLSYFERRRAHITWMVDRIVGDAVAGSGSAGGGSLGDGFGGGGGGGEGTLGNGDPFGGIGESTVQQLVPLEKMLTAVLNDARETCDALNRFLDDDREVLGSLLLSLNSSSSSPLQLPPHDLAVPGVAAAAAAGTGAVEVTASPPPPLAEVAAAAAAAAPRRGGFGVLTPTIGVDPLKRREMLRNQAMEDASRILETYLREVQSVVGSLLEKEDFLDSTRETYRMQLDSARNHIILVNLWISVASISLMVATLPSAFFGMNVEHGLEEVWVAFPLIVALSVGLAVGSFPALLRFFTNRFLRQTRQGTRNLLMLRAFLMQHSDDLEAITEALRSLPVAAGLEGSPISRTAFRTHMRNRLPRHVTLSDSHLDYLFNQFDRDNDGVLSEAEATLRSKLSYSGSSGSGGGGSRRGGSGSGRGSSSRHRPLTLDGGPGSLGGVVGSDGEPFLDELDGQVDVSRRGGSNGSRGGGSQFEKD